MPNVPHPTRALFLSPLILLCSTCQIIGGLEDLQLALVSGSGGAGGEGGTSSVSTSSSSGSGGGGSDTPVSALWSRALGDTSTQSVTDVAVDKQGNIFVAGYFVGTLAFDPAAPLISAGDYDAFLAKLDTDGNHLWSIRFGGTGPDRVESLSLTSTGDPVVGGSYGAAFSIGMTNFTFAGGIDALVARFSGTDGTLAWGQRFGDAQDSRCAAVSVAVGNDAVTCLGDFSGVVDVGGSSVTSAGALDLVVVQYSSTGTLLTAARSGDLSPQIAKSVAATPGGIIFGTARFNGVMDWGPVTSAGGGDVFLGRLIEKAPASWALRMGDSNTQQPNGMSIVGANGGVALVGDFEGFADFGGKAITSKGLFDAFVTRVDAAGKVLWVRTIGDADPMTSTEDQYATDVAAMDDGTLFVTGYAAGTINFGDGVVSGPSDTDFYVLRMDATGQTEWHSRVAASGSQFGRAIALSGTDEFVVVGDFRNTMDLGNGPLTSAGNNDVFVAKFKR